MENLGEKLKSLRIDRGWTQSKMGELLSVSQDTVSLWERNKSLPDLGAVVRIDFAGACTRMVSIAHFRPT